MGKVIIGGVEFKFQKLYVESGETDEIEPYMFYENKALTYAEMEMVKIINDWAFRGCQNLQTGIFKGARVLGNWVFGGCGFNTIEIPNVISIGNNCFRNSSIEVIELNDEIIEIEEGTFRECASLKNVKLPINLEVIGHYAFYRSTKIEQMQVPAMVTRIGDYAFFLSGAGELILSEEVLIGEESFWGCHFTKIVIKKLNTVQRKMFEYSSVLIAEFENAEFIKEFSFQECKKLTNIYIPKVKEIEGYTFNNCINLSINFLPDTLEKLGVASFAFTKIAVTRLPKKINIIPNSCFYGCSSLNSLILGDVGYPINLIENFAFEQCTNLASLTIYTTGGQALEGAPWGATNATITYLPA